MIKKMRALSSILIFGIVLCSLSLEVYASINTHEQRVYNVATAIYAYNGKQYQATESAKSELYSYLNQEDIDLVESQANEAISKFYANIPQGIAEGYMVEVPGSTPPTQPTDPAVSEQPTEPISEEPETVIDKDNNIVVSEEPEPESEEPKVEAATLTQSDLASSQGIISIVTRDNNEKSTEKASETVDVATEAVTSEQEPAQESEQANSIQLSAEEANLLWIVGIIASVTIIAIPVSLFVRKKKGRKG